MKKSFLIAALACQLILGQFTLTAFAQLPATGPQPQPKSPQSEPQQPARPSEEETVRITTKLVQVDAVITDKNAKLVTDLRPEEVRILEDGRPQKITHFSLVTAGNAAGSTGVALPAKSENAVDKSAPPPPPVTMRPEEVRRTIALVVDDLGLSAESIIDVRSALKKFVDKEMQPGDLVAIIKTGSGIGALQQFTSDKRMLYAAVERVKWNPMSRAGLSAVPRIESSPIVDALPANQEAEAAAFLANAENLREDAITTGTLGALGYVVRGLGELPGRKSILLISDGVKVFRPDDRDNSNRVLQALQRLADLANRASVVIHSMDPRGLQTLAQTAADNVRITKWMNPTPIQTQLARQLDPRRDGFFESQNGLNYLAQQTGGLFVRNRNDLNDGIHSIMEDQKGYYLIGYRPDDSTFDPKTGGRKFHALTLKVTRPGKFNVRTRKGFYGVTDAESKPELRTASQQVVNALTSPFGAAGVHIRLTSAFANDAQLGSLLSSMLHVRASDLTFTDEPDGWYKAEFDIVAITYGDNGSVVDQVGQTHSIKVRSDTYEHMLKEGFVYIVTVPIRKPGAYQLRAALRDHGSERVGSASQFVEVPDIKRERLLLSGVLLTGVDPTSLKKAEPGTASAATSSGANEAKNQSAEDPEVMDPTNSAAVRQFHRGQVLQYGVAVYNAQLDKTTGRPQLQINVRLFRDSKPVFTGEPQEVNSTSLPDLKRISAAGAIQLGTNLVPGEYVLQVIVTDLLADRKHRVTTQWIDFEIVK